MEEELAARPRPVRFRLTFSDAVRLGLRNHCAGHVCVKNLRRRPFTSGDVFDDLRS